MSDLDLFFLNIVYNTKDANYNTRSSAAYAYRKKPCSLIRARKTILIKGFVNGFCHSVGHKITKYVGGIVPSRASYLVHSICYRCCHNQPALSITAKLAQNSFLTSDSGASKDVRSRASIEVS